MKEKTNNKCAVSSEDNKEKSAVLTKNYASDDFCESYSIMNSQGGEITGAGIVKRLTDSAPVINLSINIDSDGFYDFGIFCFGDKGRTDNINVDGFAIGNVTLKSDERKNICYVRNVYLDNGSHVISIVKSWGLIEYERIVIRKSNAITETTYKVACGLSNPNADEHTCRLYSFLCDIFGRYTLSGQFCGGRGSNEHICIKKETGKEFAVMGLDMAGYDSASLAHSEHSEVIEQAYDWSANAGGIVQLCWHWHSPDGYTSEGAQWYRSFYVHSSKINIDMAMNQKDKRLYRLLIEDIHLISEKLRILRDNGVPVLWRPLHEASGGWFWWGTGTSDSYVKLYRLMYDIMTNEYGLTNLIWVWNGQSAEWYPGDDVVDIVSYDVYSEKHNYGSQSGVFADCASVSSQTKLVALSENGVIMDPELTYRDNSRWLYFGVWNGEFILKNDSDSAYSESFTELSMLKKAYGSEYVLTLDELPDLYNYTSANK